ncbi:AMP-binding protein [Undibacterium macrobrachii]|jgi:2-aminobenzoate-CoA ligase|uniref:2-aminobenzoate-CoA ligase n=1 Tax=Undibacterium macrobrachii TaxID=1119058 RepID=A0ABQ2X842_9BURK|nr:AMP-binding protein [Undibacterium macrobrachii]GGX03414.1 2-aminobenzoate-CoA ligase [Undibacterium macrobrachii]
MSKHFFQSAHVDTFAFQHLPPPEQWPELIFDLPELQYPERLNCANAFLEEIVAQGFADKVAIRSSSASANEVWTYAELCAKVNQIAHVIVDEMRLVPGNRVLLRGANNPMMAACILAVWKVGCVAVPTMPLLRAKELSVIIDKAQISAALCSSALHEELDAAQKLSPVLQHIKYFNSEEVGSVEQLMQSKPTSFTAVDTHAEDVCLISFTSGTTGMPKGTMHFHRDVLAICDCFPRSILQSQPSDTFIGTPPLAFTFGLGGLLLFPLRIGATAVLLEKLTPETLLKSIDEYQATVCFTAPTFYRQMLPMVPNFFLKTLQKTVSAGETLPAATREAWQAATGLIMIDGIGATEMLHIFISAAGEHARSGATGKAVPGYQACVLDEQGNPAPVGVTGRLAVKGPTGCRYLADERQKNYVLNGWNLTGDAYEIDAEGYFHYRARTDDMIITAGYNVAGPEVEEIILKHPAVAECAVVGLPDEERGQIVKAFVVLRDASKVSDPLASEALVSEIQQFVKANVAPYKYPRCIEFKDALPRTETGKVQRFKLKTNTPK